MYYALTSEEMKECDSFTIKNLRPSIELMETAGTNFYDEIIKYINKNEKILVVAGGGGNGGDALVVARHLYNNGYNVETFISSSHLKEETLINKNRYNGKLISYNEFLKNDYDVIVDGLLGANLSVQINEKTKVIINTINDKKARVFSIDIASGIDASSGKNLGAFVHSFLTVAIEAFKIGHFFFDGKNSYEKLSLVSANVELINKENYLNILKRVDFCRVFEKRDKNSNKGTYGKVALVGGSKLTPGAILLSNNSLASLRVGAGYSRLFIPRSLYEIYALHYPEIIYETLSDENGKIVFVEEEIKKLLAYDSIAIGMGIGTSIEVYKIIKFLCSNYNGNLLIDADGLNSLARFGKVEDLKESKCKNIVLTPHIKEFSRLIKNDDLIYIKENAIYLTKKFAKDNKVILVLKDSTSIISDGTTTYLNINGNPSLAKGGSGDILSGIIAGLISKKENILFSVACSCYLLGEASDLAIKENNENTLIATDITRYLMIAVNELTK